MTRKRFVATTVVAFLVTQVLATAIHGFVLAADYEPFEGSLLRAGGGGPVWQMLFLPVAHVAFIGALVWIYARVSLAGSAPLRALKLGTLGWLIGQVPLWLIWYAQQPWTGELVIKQLALEWLSTVIVGFAIVAVAGSRTRRSAGLVDATV